MKDWMLVIILFVIILPCVGMLVGLVLRKAFKVAPKEKEERDSQR